MFDGICETIVAAMLHCMLIKLKLFRIFILKTKQNQP